MTALREAVELLDAANEHNWAFRLRGDLERLEEGDGGVLDHLVSAYGGMGGFDDLHICPENGHKVMPADVPAVNQRLQQLSGSIWQLAQELR